MTKKEILTILDEEINELKYVYGDHGHRNEDELFTTRLLIQFQYEKKSEYKDDEMSDIIVSMHPEESETELRGEDLKDHHVIALLEKAGLTEYAENMDVEIFTGS
jgi:hypothetical protein